MKRHGRLVAGFVLLALAVGLVAPAPAQEKPWWPFPVEDRDPPFNMEGKKVKKDYVPIDHAAKKWNMCVSFPHMKDAYWIAVDYGVVSESRRLGVKMQLVEAGGYTNLAKQVSQIEDCVAQGANAFLSPRKAGDSSGKWRRMTVAMVESASHCIPSGVYTSGRKS